MEKKNFKKKLTLSVTSSTKSVTSSKKRSDSIIYENNRNKNSVIIEKKILDQDLEKLINNLLEIQLNLILRLVDFLTKIYS